MRSHYNDFSSSFLASIINGKQDVVNNSFFPA